MSTPYRPNDGALGQDKAAQFETPIIIALGAADGLTRARHQAQALSDDRLVLQILTHFEMTSSHLLPGTKMMRQQVDPRGARLRAAIRVVILIAAPHEIVTAAAEPMHDQEATNAEAATAEPEPYTPTCPCCGSKMRIIEIFQRGQTPHHKASPRPQSIRIDTS